MKRPQSPRRDYLLRCAEKQLLPVPVINRALKLDPSTDLSRKIPRTADVRHGHEVDREYRIAKLTGAEGKRGVCDTCREISILKSFGSGGRSLGPHLLHILHQFYDAVLG